jgi:hypothetical protein
MPGPSRPLIVGSGWAVAMNEEQKPVDVTVPLLELLRSIDFAFEQKSRGPATPQSRQEEYAAALAGIGRFLMKIDPTHADDFFELSDAFADQSIGSRPVVLRPKKVRSAPNPTQIEAAKAYIAFALDALISLGETPKTAAKTLITKFPCIKELAGPKSHRPDYEWPKTILEGRKTLSAPSRKKNALAVEIFAVGRDLIDFLIKAGRQSELKARALSRAKYAERVGVFLAGSNPRL